MTDKETISVLSHLLAIHNRSLPMYLRSAVPWTEDLQEPGLSVLDEVATAHQEMVNRIGEMIIEREGAVRYGEFPMRFTQWHDLSVDFLLKRAVEGQQDDIARIEKCVDWLSGEPRAKAIAEEALGEARAHLEALQQAADQTTASSTVVS